MNSEICFDADEMFGWVQRQVEMGARRPGSEADGQNERFLRDQLESFGLENVRLEPIDITCWEAEEYALQVGVDGDWKTIPTFPIPYTAFTPPEGVEAPLVYADPGRLLHRGRWDGAIVVTEIGFPALDLKLLQKVALAKYDPDGTIPLVNHPATWVRLGWHLYRLAVQRGAAGFIGVVKDQPGNSCEMYAPYGFRERDILDKPLPGFWIRRSDGPEVCALARSGSGRARIKLTGSRRPAVTHNVVGEVPGETDETVVVSCHHDSPFQSPVEDGSGVAVVLALAKHFAKQRDLKRRLLFLLTAGHFYGSIGTRTFIERHAEDIVPKTAVEITIEHIAQEAVEGPDQKLVPTGLPEAAGVFAPLNHAVADLIVAGMKKHEVGRVVVLPAEGPLGDYPPTDGGDWYKAGVPVINYISNPVYLLTSDDGMGWVDRDRLPRVAGAFVEIVRALDLLSREAIASVDSRGYRLLMKLLKNVTRARTTCFGLKPVY
ncbi:MAG: M28 family peptidase [Bradymonadales bacterium]|nr:M28 family peptidase [Bradymonadales bacterium]